MRGAVELEQSDATAMFDQLRDALPQYVIEAELDRGGMGAIARSSQSASSAKLDHRNMVGVQDIGEVDGLYFLVLDFERRRCSTRYFYGVALHADWLVIEIIRLGRNLGAVGRSAPPV